MDLVLFQNNPPVKWVLFEEGNLEVGRSDARVLVGPNIFGALKHLVRHRFTRLKTWVRSSPWVERQGWVLGSHSQDCFPSDVAPPSPDYDEVMWLIMT